MFDWASFRTHILIPHRVVGSIRDNKPMFSTLTVEQPRMGVRVYVYDNKPVLKVTTDWARGGSQKRSTIVRVEALSEVWLQEPGLSVKIKDGGVWRAFRRSPFRWTSDSLPLRQKDAHRNTVHFSRYKESPDFTTGVRIFHSQGVLDFWVNGSGFMSFLDTPARTSRIPWQDCRVFNEPRKLLGCTSGPEMLRRWELAGHQPNDQSWMHFLGWTGGAAAVTDKQGRSWLGEERYRSEYLWQPRSWRRLMPGDRPLLQTLHGEKLQGKTPGNPGN